MTKKRFTLEMQYWKGNPQGRKLFDNLTGQDGMSVEELCNIASELHSKCVELESVLEVYEDSLNKLEEENKELKAKVDDKEIAVEVETCKLMEKVFDMIDKKIDELEKRYKFGQEVYKGCPMHNIRFGINTLKELKKELQE